MKLLFNNFLNVFLNNIFCKIYLVTSKTQQKNIFNKFIKKNIIKRYY